MDYQIGEDIKERVSTLCLILFCCAFPHRYFIGNTSRYRLLHRKSLGIRPWWRRWWRWWSLQRVWGMFLINTETIIITHLTSYRMRTTMKRKRKSPRRKNAVVPKRADRQTLIQTNASNSDLPHVMTFSAPFFVISYQSSACQFIEPDVVIVFFFLFLVILCRSFWNSRLMLMMNQPKCQFRCLQMQCDVTAEDLQDKVNTNWKLSACK